MRVSIRIDIDMEPDAVANWAEEYGLQALPPGPHSIGTVVADDVTESVVNYVQQLQCWEDLGGVRVTGKVAQA